MAQFNSSSAVTTYRASVIESRVRGEAYTLSFHNNTVFNFQFTGDQSHLISIATRGALSAEDNSFIEIGQPTRASPVRFLPYGTPPPEQDFQFTHDRIVGYTADAIFRCSNTLDHKGKTNVIKRNYFRRVYGQKAAIYEVEQAYEDIKYNIEDNFYHEIFGGRSAILNVNQNEDFATQFDLLSYVRGHPQGIGLIKIQNDQVVESQALDPEGALYALAANWPLMAVIMKNTTLISIQKRILHADQITTYLQNVVVDYQEDQLKRLLAESDRRLQRTGPQVTSHFVQQIHEAEYFEVLRDQIGRPSSEKYATQGDESKAASSPTPSSAPTEGDSTSDAAQSSTGRGVEL